MQNPALSFRDTNQLSRDDLLAEIDRLNFFIKSTMDQAYEWSLDSNDIYVSQNLSKLLGYPSLWIVHDTLLNSIHPDHQALHRTTVESHFNNHRHRVVLEYQILEKSGNYCWVEENGVALRDANGKPVSYVATVTDISPRKLAENGLLESNARLLAIMENTSSPISLKDNAGRFVLVNDIFCIKQGLTRHDVIGKTVYELFDKKTADEVSAQDQAVIDGKKPIPFELSAIDPDNKTHTFISDRFPIFSADGALIGVGSLETDITERKQMEAALRASEQEMRLLAATDPLTGARNRRSFFEIGNSELARSIRYSRSLTLLMMDIDHFKKFNDTYGHAAGDLVLKNFAKECNRTLREQDTLGRLGGEEFGVVLPEIDLKTAFLIAERLRQNLMKLETHLDGEILKFTVSIGISECHLDDKTIDAALSKADSALYRAKQNGRNQVAN